MKTVELRVKGMHCAGCERAVSFLLTGVEGVHEASADRRSEKVAVAYDDARVEEDVLRARIEAAGYEVA